jgi:hypothetical protein
MNAWLNKPMTLLVFCFLAAVVCSAQREDGYVWIGNAANSMMYVRDFSSIDIETIRSCHGKGTIRIRVSISEDGNVEKASLLRGVCKRHSEAVLDAVRLWTFKQHLVDGTATKYRGYVHTNVWYGAVDANDP